jgi:hypothetical protein
MNDDFIKQFQKSPDSRFVERTHARLEKRERIQMFKRYSIFSTFALIFMFGMLMTFSSAARADVISIIEKIAGLHYEVTSNYPSYPDEDVITIYPEYLSLEDARSRFPFPIQLPIYVPDGYERRTDVELYYWGDGAPELVIRWEDNDKHTGHIFLRIKHCSSNLQPCGLIVGEGALEEITLNGKPAVVVRGSWNYDTHQYDLSAGIDIQWRYDENTVYTLSTWGEDKLEELIKTAESIP